MQKTNPSLWKLRNRTSQKKEAEFTRDTLAGIGDWEKRLPLW
jgi:hypothetical protein